MILIYIIINLITIKNGGEEHSACGKGKWQGWKSEREEGRKMMRLKDRSNKVCLKLSFHGCKNCGFVCVHV